MFKMTKISIASLLAGSLLLDGNPVFGAFNDPVVEVEPNNDKEHAMLLKEGEVVTGKFVGEDMDAYRLEIPEDGLVTLNKPTGYGGITVFDSSESGYDEQWGNTFYVEAGTYHVYLWYHNTSLPNDPYSFSWTFETWTEYFDRRLCF